MFANNLLLFLNCICKRGAVEDLKGVNYGVDVSKLQTMASAEWLLSSESALAAKRDLNWYEFGKNMDFIEGLLKAAGQGEAVDCVWEKFKKLEARLRSGREVQYLSAVKDLHILFEAVLDLPKGAAAVRV